MTAAAVIAALRFAREHGSATAALDETGLSLPDTTRFEGIESDCLRLLGQSTLDDPLRPGIAFGFLAGCAARRSCDRRVPDPTAFVIDQDLVIQAAKGDSILRLPWFANELFVGRQVPDIPEIPTTIRSLAVQKYRTALTGERTDFAFTSYGHAYSVDAVPMRDDEGSVDAVLVVAVPRQTRPDDQPQLTARELEVLTLASQGMNYAEIATQLFLTHATVKTHLAHIYAKLHVRDKAAAVAVALRSGLIE